MTYLLGYLRPYRGRIAIVIVLLLVQAITNLYLPDLNANIINEGISKGDTEYIIRTGGMMLLVTLLMGVASIISVYFGSMTAMSFGRDLRSAVFRQVQQFSETELNRFGTASLITRNTNDVTQVQMLVLLALNMMISAPIMAIGGIVMALRQDVPLSGLIAVIVPLMAAVIGIVLRMAMPLFKQMQLRVDDVNRIMREKLAGMRVIRAFVRTDYEQARFSTANEALTDTALRVNRIFAATMPTMMGIFNLSTVAIMWFGGFRVESGAMPIGDLTAFFAYIMQILMSVMMASIMFVMVPRAAASAERIREILEVDPEIRDPQAKPPSALGHGTLTFDHVEFRYPGAQDPVLCDVSFSAMPGEITAIVGGTGSGKTTLVNLIPRFFDVSSGRVLIDGVDVREAPQHWVWDRIGFVPQRAFLFSGTVASNMRLGKEDATDDEIWRALEVAQAAQFVRDMPDGLDAVIEQGGSNVSGGQRQRLAIARALIKRPEIYVFDDSFSALDYRTDAALRNALVPETRDATVLIVAQRVSTIRNADRIIVLDEGTVVGIGTHDQLLASCETYREIVESQATAEEAA